MMLDTNNRCRITCHCLCFLQPILSWFDPGKARAGTKKKILASLLQCVFCSIANEEKVKWGVLFSFPRGHGLFGDGVG